MREPEDLVVSGESLVQPDVVPGGAGHVVAPPHVGELVAVDPVEVPHAATEVVIAHAGERLVFHAAAPGEGHHPVLLVEEGILSGESGVIGDHVWHPRHRGCGVGQPLGIDVVLDGHDGLSIEARVVIGELQVISHVGGDEVVGERVVFSPGMGDRAIRIGGRSGERPVGGAHHGGQGR